MKRRPSMYKRAKAATLRALPLDAPKPFRKLGPDDMRAWYEFGYLDGYRAAKRDARREP